MQWPWRERKNVKDASFKILPTLFQSVSKDDKSESSSYFEVVLGVCYAILTSSKCCNLIRFPFPSLAHFEVWGKKRTYIYMCVCHNTSFFSESNCIFRMEFVWKHSCINLYQNDIKNSVINQWRLKIVWTGSKKICCPVTNL